MKKELADEQVQDLFRCIVLMLVGLLVVGLASCATTTVMHPDGTVTRSVAVDWAGARAALSGAPESAEALRETAENLRAVREAFDAENAAADTNEVDQALDRIERAIDLLDRLSGVEAVYSTEPGSE